MTTEPEFIEASPKARWMLATFVLTLIIGYVGIDILLPLDADTVMSLSASELEDFQQKLQLKTGITASITLVAAVAWTAYLWPIAQSALATSRFPPPGALLVRRTRVVTGTVARIQAFAYIFWAVISWVPVAVFAYIYYLTM